MRIVWGSKYEERAIMPTFFAILFDIFFMCSFQVKKSMHWFVCLLHTNELPLRHLLVHLDGATHGPNSFSGTIGKQLKDCCDMPIVTFQRIEGNVLRNIDPNDLSTDQKYLLEMCQAITTGQCSTDFGNRKLGPMCHSRWLTTANRILRLYISKENPDKHLVTLANYIVKCKHLYGLR